MFFGRIYGAYCRRKKVDTETPVCCSECPDARVSRSEAEHDQMGNYYCMHHRKPIDDAHWFAGIPDYCYRRSGSVPWGTGLNNHDRIK